MIERDRGLYLLLRDANGDFEAAGVQVSLNDGEFLAVQVFQTSANDGKPIAFALFGGRRSAAAWPSVADGEFQLAIRRSNEDIHRARAGPGSNAVLDGIFDQRLEQEGRHGPIGGDAIRL